MSHVIVERRTLFWPRGVTGTGLSTIAIPGNPVYGTLTHPRGDAAASYDGDTYASLLSTAEEACHRIDIPADVIAIGIAPDSIIHSCDIALGGQMNERDRVGIAPGSPLLGCVGASFALVSLRTPIPLIPVASTFALDSNAIPTGIDPLSPLTAAAWPLRLELFRSCSVPPQRSDKRVPMASLSLFSIGSGNTERLVSCVDGRSKVDLEIAVPSTSAGTVTVSVYAYAPSRATARIDDASIEIPVPLDGAGTLTAAVAPGAGTILSFDGSPFPSGVLVISLAASVGTADVQVRIRGWD